jgi:hypothetical protein
MFQEPRWFRLAGKNLLLGGLTALFVRALLLDDNKSAFPYTRNNWLTEMHFQYHTFMSAW